MKTKRKDKGRGTNNRRTPYGLQIIVFPELSSMSMSISTSYLQLSKILTNQLIGRSLNILQNWVIKADKSRSTWKIDNHNPRKKKKKRIERLPAEYSWIWGHMQTRNLIFQSTLNFVSPIYVMTFCASFALFDFYD